MVFQILNTGKKADGAHRTWLEPGIPLLAAPGCTLRLMLNSQDGEPEPVLRLEMWQQYDWEVEIPVARAIYDWPDIPVEVLPLAAEMDDQGEMCRVLVEIVHPHCRLPATGFSGFED